MTTVTKATLATTLFAQLGLNKREAADMVDHFFEEIICGSDRVYIISLGL